VSSVRRQKFGVASPAAPAEGVDALRHGLPTGLANFSDNGVMHSYEVSILDMREN
jgi:hypothetical protein